MRILRVAVVVFMLIPLFAQSQKSTGTVTASGAEFRIPIQPPANGVWIWNRAETPENAIEYCWTVTVESGAAHYSFGVFLYKFPGSYEERGQIQDLIKAGQASVFKEAAEGQHGEIMPDAKVAVAVEKSAILIRITNSNLIRIIFGDRPKTVAIHSRSPEADYQVVPLTYQD